MDWTPKTVERRIDKLRKEWADCKKCKLHRTRTNVVFGQGNPTASILFIGEGPGEMEDKTGIPFHPEAASGLLLADLLEAVGLDRNDCYITNAVCCRPPENRDPTKIEQDACYPRLRNLIYNIDPIIIVPIGKIAMKQLIKGAGTSIKNNQGQLFEIEIEGVYSKVTYPAIPILHPAFINRTDAVNPKTGMWPSGGNFAKTLDTLVRIKQIVEFLQDGYERGKKLRIINE